MCNTNINTNTTAKQKQLQKKIEFFLKKNYISNFPKTKIISYFPHLKKKISACYNQDDKLRNYDKLYNIINKALYDLLSSCFIQQMYDDIDNTNKDSGAIVLTNANNSNNKVIIKINEIFFQKCIYTKQDKFTQSHAIEINCNTHDVTISTKKGQIIKYHQSNDTNVPDKITFSINDPKSTARLKYYIYCKNNDKLLKEYFTEILPSLTFQQQQEFMEKIEDYICRNKIYNEFLKKEEDVIKLLEETLPNKNSYNYDIVNCCTDCLTDIYQLNTCCNF